MVHNRPMNDPEPIDPRRRIRELTAIPERDRTDEQWDELNELEIRTAPGNRESERQLDRSLGKRPGSTAPVRRPDRNAGFNGNGTRLEARPQDGRPESRPPKRQHRRSKRPVGAPGNS